MGSTQRAFTQKLSKQHPADVRRNVACHKSGLISPSSTSSWTNDVVEPLDYEDFVSQYQLLIDRDPLRNILDVPLGDVEVDQVERPIRTLQPIVPEEKLETLPPHVRACVECYKSNWSVIRYNHRALSSSVSSRSHLSKTLQPSPKQEFEVDFQVTPSGASSELDLTSVASSGRQSVASIGSLSSCGDTLTPRNSWASLDLRHSAGDQLIPDILEPAAPETLDLLNESRRQTERQEVLFALCPSETDVLEQVEKRVPATNPYEHLGHRVLVKCQQLTMDIEVEPLFASMALYDCKERKKVSETFHFDLNPEGLKRMLGGHVPYSDASTLARGCIFNISHPSPDLFIVVRLEKVLQGDINECVEPYLKEDKNRDKLKANAVSVCERLGKFRQAFAWTAINLVNVINGGNSMERESDKDSGGSGSNTNSLDRKSSGGGLEQLRRRAADMGTLTRRGSLERRAEKRRSWSPDHLATSLDSFRPITLTMSSFFKQECDKLKDDDLYKCLQELKRPTIVIKKLKCIPATLKLEILPCPMEYKNCLTTELSKLHPYPDDKSRPTKELIEFPVKELLVPHYTYRNLLYVSPKELNFSNRTGSARNLAVRVQLMAGEGEHHAVYNIFGKSSCPELTNEAYSVVSYHNKSPVFYDEIKIKLPAALADNHHLLFTFYHISCQKKLEQSAVDTPVGYTWLPLLRDGRLVSGDFCLPVMLEPPPLNYSYIPPDVCLPGTKWLDNHKGLFTVTLDTVSSVHTQDPPLERFLTAYDFVHTGVVPARLGENGSENELRSAMMGLSGARPETIVRHLPLIFDSIILLLVQPPRLGGHTLNIGHNCFEALCLLLEKLSNLQELATDQHSRNALLATYIQYQCSLPHPLCNSNHNSPDWEGSGTLTRSSSNPDLEVAHLQHSRGLDRACSMRTPSVEPMSPNISTCHKIVHQELALQWVVSSGRSKDMAMQNAWFLFEIIIKSMVEHLEHTNTLDSPRKLRFSDQFLDDISTLVHTVTAEIISHSTVETRKAHKLNAALAFFFFDLLSIADRGYVLQMLRSYNKQLQAKISSIQESKVLVELKLDFARIICSHEHYVALNLPFATPFMSTGASVSPSPSVASSTSQNSFLSGPPASQERSSTFAELSPEYRQHHFLTGMVLTDMATVLLDMHFPALDGKAVDTVKSLLSWHDSDPRYVTPEARRRVAALYLPVLTVAMDVLPLLHHFALDKTDRYAAEDGGSANINPAVALAISGKVVQTTCDTFSTIPTRKSGLSADVTRNLLTCVLWVLKNVERESLSHWMGELSSSRLATLLHLLDACTSCFEYRPRRRAPPPQGYAHAQVTDMRSRLEDIILGQGSAREMMQRRKGGGSTPAASEKLRWRKEQMTYRAGTDMVDRPQDNLINDIHLEGHLATEASFIILDTLEKCVTTVAQCDSQQHLVGLALTVLLHALGKNQSTTVLPHMFATQRSLVYKFHSALFDEESSHCADLCLLLLKHCGSQIASVRSQAAASLYLLMRQTFQIGNNFARVKMQVTMSLSSLVGTSASFSDDSLRRSLKTILEYGERDSELQETTFPEQVRDLVFNLHMILSDTVKMKEFQEDPEMLMDLMYRIAKGYQNSPDLRLTWLANMAQKHMERGNHCEAGMCLVHSAALVAEYLVMLESLPHLPVGAAALERVSPNVLEESAVSDDVLSPEREGGGCLGSHFTEAGLLALLEHAASSFNAAAMYEPMNDIYRVLIPIAENNRDFKKLSNIHGKLQDAYTRIDQLHGKRMFGTYFRVGFYGTKFGDLDGEEFIYKEPTLTKLPEIFSRLENFYAERFGPENVIIIKDSNKVISHSLDSEKAYIQITYVEPYFEQYELRYRQTHFDRNFNIKRFIYATPFTQTGKAHGELKDQFKRKTILTTAVHFPYVKTRIQVVNRVEITLTPIEVAIEDIQKKTAELAAATTQEPPDPKILQMVLQGCIGTTVNQGPLEMAVTFLPGDGKALTRHQNKLRLCFKDFSKKCQDALKKNKNLIGPDQRDYQKELDRNCKRFIEKLQPLVNTSTPVTITTASPHKYSSETSTLRW